MAERVYGMIVGFSGFGFPKAHGAAFGLLAYQSTWLRVHYGPEFLCALLNEQPMGFYASDTLAHEAQRRGIEMRAPTSNASEALCTVESAEPGVVRLGLGYVLGVREEEIQALVAARAEGGPFRSLADLASRAGAGRPALDRLAWAGACDSLAGGSAEHARRRALWQLGVAAPGERLPSGTQLALPLEVPAAPALRPLVPWESMIADYATTGLTLGPHPMALLRAGLPAGSVSIADLERLPHDTPCAAGRPGGGAPATRDGEGDRVPAARGRVRDDQPDRPARPLRGEPPDRAHASRCCCARAGSSGCRWPAGRSTCS